MEIIYIISSPLEEIVIVQNPVDSDFLPAHSTTVESPEIYTLPHCHSPLCQRNPDHQNPADIEVQAAPPTRVNCTRTHAYYAPIHCHCHYYTHVYVRGERAGDVSHLCRVCIDRRVGGIELRLGARGVCLGEIVMWNVIGQLEEVALEHLEKLREIEDTLKCARNWIMIEVSE